MVAIIRYKCEASVERHCAASTGSGVVMVDGGQDFCSQGGNRTALQAKPAFFAGGADPTGQGVMVLSDLAPQSSGGFMHQHGVRSGTGPIVRVIALPPEESREILTGFSDDLRCADGSVSVLTAKSRQNLTTGGSFSGRTRDFDSRNDGSTPSPPSSDLSAWTEPRLTRVK